MGRTCHGCHVPLDEDHHWGQEVSLETLQRPHELMAARVDKVYQENEVEKRI